MKAMILDGQDRPLREAEPPRPKPGFDEILLKVHACGVCRTDLHVMDGDLLQPKLPLILGDIIAELRETLLGWKAYFGIAEVLSPLHDIDKWIRRRLRCYQWKQWGRAGYRELRRRGVSVREAWNTSKSAHGPWRLSKSPALALALPVRHFSTMGLPCLAGR